MKKIFYGKENLERKSVALVIAFVLLALTLAACGDASSAGSAGSSVTQDSETSDSSQENTAEKSAYVLTSITESQSDGTEGTFVECTYDDEGNLLTWVSYFGSDFDCVYRSETYTWYGSGAIKSCETAIGSEELMELYVSLYSSFVIKPVHTYYEYNEEGNVTFAREYTYLEDETSEYSNAYTLDVDYWTEFTYDDDGNLLIAKQYDGDGTMSHWGEATYYSDGTMASEAEYDDEGQKEQEYTYDERGEVLTYTRYNDDGSVASSKENTYDENGNLILTTVNGETTGEYTYDQDGNKLTGTELNTSKNKFYYYEYAYYSSGQCQSETVYDEDGKLYRQNVYDRLGELRSEIYYNTNSDGEEYEIVLYEATFDSDGNCLTYYDYNGESKATKELVEYYYYEYTYYTDGALKERSKSCYETDDDGTVGLTNTEIREFDENGNLLSEVTTSTKGSEKEAIYTYNGDGRVLTITISKDGVIESVYEYEYDAAGNRITYTYYGENGVLKSSKSYEYDTAGNMVKEASYDENGELEGWTEYTYGTSLVEKEKQITIYENGEQKTKYEDTMEPVVTGWTEYDSDGTAVEKYVGTEDETYLEFSGVKIFSVSYSYGEMGLLETDSDTGVIYLEALIYDENGNIGKGYECVTDETGNILTYCSYNTYDSGEESLYEYSYSEDGRLLKILVYENGEASAEYIFNYSER